MFGTAELPRHWFRELSTRFDPVHSTARPAGALGARRHRRTVIAWDGRWLDAPVRSVVARGAVRCAHEARRLQRRGPTGGAYDANARNSS